MGPGCGKQGGAQLYQRSGGPVVPNNRGAVVPHMHGAQLWQTRGGPFVAQAMTSTMAIAISSTLANKSTTTLATDGDDDDDDEDDDERIWKMVLPSRFKFHAALLSPAMNIHFK